MYGTRLARWEKAMEWPLAFAALIFFAAYAVEITLNLGGTEALIANLAISATWVVFAVDYVVRISIAENRWRWFYTHLLDLAIVALPLLRPLRLMRFFTVLALIQRGAGDMLRSQVVIYTVGATVLMIVVSALAVLDAERDEGTITTFGDAIWWAFVTITTVGYGDYFPVTLTGRVVSVGLMIGGIALIGVVTATLASWIVERVADKVSADVASPDSATPDAATPDAIPATAHQVDELRREVAELKAMIRERTSDA
jgi:voltage-gated potassium channel